ncbi:hypothetical protein BOW53_04380 [Solemya pervernicosa gill symbiont]|uniref:FecR protein domain-containing protein n=2 Tax=Gammaproteobacteria incertae sedis TaxID=118884 RepID=A0A1T2L8C2_9GAMM|nr:FecR domain-containing protein [Candidatus Reidiella endopervernicosa]OOZ41358.1 hypothetical protein BOW53_04380 [Solemya pervernicosa gill symbiont]QKQ27736.1 FecR domain-containing protein [Candidatus Reidiella endopervernicosa]
MTNSLFKTLIITLATIANTTVVYAASTDDAGYIARQRNDVRINEDPAHKGDIFSSQDMIVTGEKIFSMLKFRDNSSMFVKANSKVSISEYQYNKNDPKDSKVVVELTEGGLRALSGAIGKANPQAVEFRTPVGTIGIRGTDFIVSIVDGQLFMEVLDGAIMVENTDGEPVLLQAGQVLVLGADGTLAAHGNQAKKIGKKSGAFTEFTKVSFSGDQENSPYSWGPWTVTDIANPTDSGDGSDGSSSTTALDETTIPNETASAK